MVFILRVKSWSRDSGPSASYKLTNSYLYFNVLECPLTSLRLTEKYSFTKVNSAISVFASLVREHSNSDSDFRDGLTRVRPLNRVATKYYSPE